MNKNTIAGSVITLAVATLGFFPVSSAVAAIPVPDSEHVNDLLSDAKTMAYRLKEDAGAMESYSRLNLSWQSHGNAITRIKEHINDLGSQVTKLKDAKDGASPWQKNAIDRITPVLQDLAATTTSVIEHINKRPAMFTSPEYKDYLEANADYSADLAAMIGEFVETAKARQRLEASTEKVEVASR